MTGSSSALDSSQTGRDGEPPFDPMKALKIETRDAHVSIESVLDFMRADFSRTRYRSWLAGFWGFYRPFEIRLRASPVAASLRFDLEARSKVGALRRDLEVLDFTETEIAALPLCDDLPVVASAAAFFGANYVVEGSTLGGQILTRHFRASLSESDRVAVHFFNVYGERTGVMWTDFAAEVRRHITNPDDLKIAVETARATFSALEKWMRGP